MIPVRSKHKTHRTASWPPAQAAVSQHGQGCSVGHPPWTGHKYWALYPLSASHGHSGDRAHQAARAQGGAISVVDNSMLAPMFAQPLSLGADICMTSATKFIGGHSDLTAGILSVKEEELAKRVAFVQVGGLVSCAWQLQPPRSTALSLSEWGLGLRPCISWHPSSFAGQPGLHGGIDAARLLPCSHRPAEQGAQPSAHRPLWC